MRNVVPRQGTETQCCVRWIKQYVLRNVVPRQGTETLILFYFLISSSILIEKCSSPTGDGNQASELWYPLFHTLRNVVPRQGTETVLLL